MKKNQEEYFSKDFQNQNPFQKHEVFKNIVPKAIRALNSGFLNIFSQRPSEPKTWNLKKKFKGIRAKKSFLYFFSKDHISFLNISDP